MDTGCWWGNLKEETTSKIHIGKTGTLKLIGGHRLVSCGQVLMAGF